MRLKFPETETTSIRKIEKRLIGVGFPPIRQKGTHVFFENESGLTTVVPNHPGEDVGRGLIRKIAKDIGLELNEFLNDI